MKNKEWNNNLDEAPYNCAVEVINDCMDESILATRGFVMDNGRVHKNQHYFTEIGSRNLCIPNKWRIK